MRNNLPLEESIIHKILRTTTNSQLDREDKSFAEKQLRKIYSEQLSRMINDKKFYLLVDQHRQAIDFEFQDKISNKMASLSKMQEQTLERREKILNDRLKTYKMNDKEWTLKTQSIQQQIKQKEKQMLLTAEEYRKRSEIEWKQRQTQQQHKMKLFSQKYHTLFNSHFHTSRTEHSPPLTPLPVNRKKLDLLKKKRESNHKIKQLEMSIKTHQLKQHSLSESKSKEQLEKLMNKLQKIEHNQQKREQKMKTQSLERQKVKSNLKIYKPLKDQIGPNCPKHDHKLEQFKLKTEEVQSPPTLHKNKSLQHSGLKLTFSYAQTPDKNQTSWEQYCKKTRRIRLSRMLKMNVRSTLSSQFKNQRFASQISPL